MAKTEATQIKYHMLTSADGGVTWTHAGTVLASNREAAIRRIFVEPEEGVQYNAVAESSWRPVMLTTKVVVREVKTLAELDAVQPVPEHVPIPGQRTVDEVLADTAEPRVVLFDGSNVYGGGVLASSS